ncbi:MAG: hypothetical protein AAF846_12740 [Chloroflexota bacterium]
MTQNIPLQQNLFTGECVDTRTAQQKRQNATQQEKTQLSMFSLREVPPEPKRASSIVDISHLASPPLALQREDPRTEEEKALARRRAMEANTYRLFDDATLYGEEEDREVKAVADPTAINKANSLINTSSTSSTPPSPKEALYHQLVTTSQEAITTLWIDAHYQQKFAILMPLTMQEAIRAGLTASEIACAVQIGQALGQTEKRAVDMLSEDANKVEKTKETQEVSANMCQQPTHPKGLRARLRQEAVNLRV